MGKVFITSANDVDATYYTVSFAGGSWDSSLPLTNLKTDRLIEVARSTSLSLSSTYFTVDLGTTRETKLICIPKGNFSFSSKWRARSADSLSGFGTPTSDTGWIDIFPVIYPYGTLPWGHKSWWTGQMTPEDAENAIMPAVHIFDTPIYSRYWRIDFDDQTNADGYLDLSRLFISPGYQPTYNMNIKASIGIETATQVLTSYGSVDHFLVKSNRRVIRFTLMENEQEALIWMHDMVNRMGRNGQAYVMFDHEDLENRHRRSMLCNIRTLSPQEYSHYDFISQPFELIEVI